MSFGVSEKWVLVEWGNATRGIVHSRYLVNVENREVKAGGNVIVGKRGEQQIATLIARSDDRSLLDQILKQSDEQDDKKKKEPTADDEPLDFSGSASSWAPSENDAPDTSDAEEEKVHKKNKSQNEEPLADENVERRPRKVLTPSNRANAVVPISMKKAAPENKTNSINKTNKRGHDDDAVFAIPTKTVKSEAKKRNGHTNKERKEPKDPKSAINPQKKDSLNQEQHGEQHEPNKEETNKRTTVTIEVDLNELTEIKKAFKELLKICKSIKRNQVHRIEEQVQVPNLQEKPVDENQVNVEAPEEPLETAAENEMEKSRSEELNRSDDNVLITNKYDIKNNVQPQIENNVEIEKKEEEDVYDIQNEPIDEEWIPIGSGKTLIQKDKFRKIKWSSYTMATRGLLLAIFPRRTLATHSLTGKRSPAFQNKPAKMCLDPKKVSDIIIEVMDRFRVRENLIRGIITTKCADECKMFKMRMKKKQADKAVIPKLKEVVGEVN